MDDTIEDIKDKINNARCSRPKLNPNYPNPILEYYKYLVFPAKEVKLNDIDI